MATSVFEFRPSAFGFRAIIPKSRLERKQMKDKVALEKGRLDRRVGHEARVHQANAPDGGSAGLVTCPEGAAGYISNSDRFHTDTSGEEYQNRMANYQRNQQSIAYRRNQTLAREETRWNRDEQKEKTEKQRWEELRENGSKSRKNVSAVAYDITSLSYKQNIAGVGQKYVDDMVRYRASLRTHKLAIQSDTRAPYNIINGGPRYVPEMPPEVPFPDNLYFENIVTVDKRRVPDPSPEFQPDPHYNPR